MYNFLLITNERFRGMRVLSVFGYHVGIGGHFNSALTFITYLREMGHHFWVIAPGFSDEMIREFADIGVETSVFRQGPRPGRHLLRSWGAEEIIRLCENSGIDVIHAQEFYSLTACYAAAIKLKRAIVYTTAGGPLNNLFPSRQINSIFYSQELIEGMVYKHQLIRDNISLIRARIDMRKYRSTEIMESFTKKYNLPDGGKKIIMAIRLESSKKLWIDNLFSFAEQITCKQSEMHIIIAGKGALLLEFKHKSSRINTRSNGPKVNMIGPVFDPREMNLLYNYADIVVGNGRGILEAMACGKPVVILGENGEGAVVDSDTIEDIAYFNFSGRHFKHHRGSRNDLLPLLEALITDDKKMYELSRFSFDYIRDHMTAEIGAGQVLRVYQRALYRKHTRSEYVRWWLKFAKDSLSTRAKRLVFRRLRIGAKHI